MDYSYLSKNMSGYGLKSLFRNPHRERAALMMEATKSIPQDRYGFSSIAKIPSMWLAGAEMGKAQRWDDELYNELYEAQKQLTAGSQEMARAKQFMDTFRLLLGNKATEGAAIAMWNELAPSILGINQKIDAAHITPEATSVHLVESGEWWGVDHRTGRPMIFDTTIGQWRTPVPEDIAKFQKKKDDVTEEGKRIFGELMDVSHIPEGDRQRYIDAMKKNLAMESPSLLKKYIELQTATRKEAPKTRTVQKGGFVVTEEFDAATGTWTEIGRGPKWNPTERQPNTMIIEHPDTKHRVAIDRKNIGELQGYLNQGYVPYSTEDQRLLQEYLNLLIKPMLDKQKAKQESTLRGTSTVVPPPKRTEGGKATPQAVLQGNTVIFKGKSYPLNPDRTVTIDDKRYKVNVQ